MDLLLVLYGSNNTSGNVTTVHRLEIHILYEVCLDFGKILKKYFDIYYVCRFVLRVFKKMFF